MVGPEHRLEPGSHGGLLRSQPRYAITNERPYKATRSVAEVVEEIRRVRGQRFDPDAIRALGVPCEERGERLDEHLAAWDVLWRETPGELRRDVT